MDLHNEKLTKKNKHPTRDWNPAIVIPVWKYKPPNPKIIRQPHHVIDRGKRTTEDAKHACYSDVREEQTEIPRL